MAVMEDLVNEVRSMINGSITDEMNVLDEEYSAASGSLTLKYPRRTVQAGTLLSVGLNTFYVLQADNSGQSLTVIPSYDGGPDTTCQAGTLVRVKPVATTWAIFREINGEINSMSSPASGIYSFGAYAMEPDWTSGMYPLPSDWTMAPTKLLLARYQIRGYTAWNRVRGAEYLAEQRAVRIYGRQPQASRIEFVLAFPFLEASDLSSDLDSLGLGGHIRDIPVLGAAANLSMTVEMQRNQIRAQGDARRPTEVPAGANLGMSREFRRVQQQRLDEEHARLLSMFGYWNEPGTAP